jgi:hypothetical protein
MREADPSSIISLHTRESLITQMPEDETSKAIGYKKSNEICCHCQSDELHRQPTPKGGVEVGQS